MAPQPATIYVLSIARLSLFSLFWFSAATAQYRFDSWTTDNGLPQNSILSIVQTRDGYLWLTTFDGLVRFDGVRFKVFDKSNTKGFSTNRFTALYEDKDGTLWIGTNDGALTRYRDGLFTFSAVPDGVPEGPVWFSRDLKGELLIGIGNGRFYMREGKFISAPPESPDLDLKQNYLAPSGSQWTIEPNEVTQIDDGRVTRYRIKLKDVNHPKPYEDSERNLWLSDEAAMYKLRDGQVTRYSQKEGVPSRGALRAYCEDDQGGVWFAGKSAVARFKDGRFTVYGEDRELAGLTITSLVEDREGTIWIGTSGGLFRLAKQFITGLSTESGLLHREVYPILQSRNGDIWVGSILGLSRYRNGVFHNTLLPASANLVQALNEDHTGRLWIGVVGGLLLYENGKLKDLSNLVGRSNTISTILTDRNGDVWVGSQHGLFQFKQGQVVAHYTTKDGLPLDDVNVIHEDRQGTLWIGTAGSLTRFEDGKFVSYPMPEGVARSHIRCIYEDADGTFWIGTYDEGLSRFRDGRFVNYRVDHGLFDNGVFHISEDRHGYFWISCNRGIYRVSRQELNDFAGGKISSINSVAYGKRDGMLNIECNGGRGPAGAVTREGKFWFPTQEGVAVVDPEAVYVNPQAPPVLIESVTLERSPVDFQNGVTIQPGQRGLEISYTGLSFIKAEQTKFKYKLEGLDTAWIDAGTRRVAYFPYLPPGNYTFRVIAANSDGVWNNDGASISFTVLTPFWRKWWFLLLCSATIAAITALVMRRQLVRFKRRQAEREAFSRCLIESQEAERKRLAGELHDSLGQNLLIVKNWALIGLNSLAEDNPAREHLTEISENATLAIEEVREISQNLRPRQLERLGLTSTIEQMIRQVRSATGIEFITDTDNIDGLLSKESEIKLYRVLQECLNNVLKHSAATTAWLSIKRTAGGAQIICRDNGKGFDPKTVSLSNGMGLIGMAERVRMLGGRYTLESAPGKGLTIYIAI